MQNSGVEFSARTRRASWERLKNNNNNPDALIPVLIVGGGIVGAGMLRELAVRGVDSAVLVEKNDFASGTSGASSKLIHAGLRYLEQVWLHIKALRLKDAWQSFCFVWAASFERKILGHLAPGLIRPKRIYLVVGAEDTRSPYEVALGVAFYWLIQIVQGQFFPPPRLRMSPHAISSVAPELRSQSVKCVIDFWDSETDDARLVIENLQGATCYGAQALNYVECVSFKQHADRVQCELFNHESQEKITVFCHVLINATGPWLDETRQLGTDQKLSDVWVDRVAGAHIDVYPPVTDKSFYMTASDGRLVFLLTRNEDGFIYNRIGTTERSLRDEERVDKITATTSEIDYLKKTVSFFLNDSSLLNGRMVRSDAAVRPLRRQQMDNSFHKSREHDIIVDGRVVYVIGVKLTDYRRVSEEMANTLPWKNWGISMMGHYSSRDIPLRSKFESQFYLEKDDNEIWFKTMALHQNDIDLRRRGLRPSLKIK